MNCAYSELYLGDAMSNLGEMSEYAYYGCGTEPDDAFRYFIISGYSDRFRVGDPCVVSGRSGTELYLDVLKKCGLPVPNPIKALVRYDADAYYWVGYVTAYYQWRANITFRAIFDTISAEDLLRMYPALHTASEERAFDAVHELYRSKRMQSRLQAYRKGLGLTQAELSEISDVNIRTLQQYETGAKELDKASVRSVYALSQALHCEPEDLISL